MKKPFIALKRHNRELRIMPTRPSDLIPAQMNAVTGYAIYGDTLCFPLWRAFISVCSVFIMFIPERI